MAIAFLNIQGKPPTKELPTESAKRKLSFCRRHHGASAPTANPRRIRVLMALAAFSVFLISDAFWQINRITAERTDKRNNISTVMIRNEDGTSWTVVTGEKADLLKNFKHHISPLNAANIVTNNNSTTTGAAAPAVDFWSILDKAGKKAFNGGYAGALAAVVQVMSLMWLRTVMNYQYRYGGSMQASLKKLWAEGGLPRLYQGLPFAIVQGPLCKFGDTAANNGVLALLDTIGLPIAIKTACGSAAAGLWRIFLMPIDTSKTAMQVEGREGFLQLWQSVIDTANIGPLYRGAFAQAAATAVGHFPWFATYNFLNGHLPIVDVANTENGLLLSLARSAFLGVAASCVSDCSSNFLRVIKTTKQTINKNMSYSEVVTFIVEKDGIAGLFGRGLQTRLATNAIQGAIFSVIWKYFEAV